MNKDPKAILLDILTIIDYQSDKEQFALQWMDLCARKAILDAVGSLPTENKELLKKEQEGVKDMDQSFTILMKYISKDIYDQKLQAVAEKMLVGYIQKILPTLGEAQKKSLQEYLSGLSVMLKA